jgi:hypothetical protein
MEMGRLSGSASEKQKVRNNRNHGFRLNLMGHDETSDVHGHEQEGNLRHVVVWY